MDLDYKAFIDIASGCNSVLEVGCGEGHFLARTITPIKIGIDAFTPVMEKGNHKNIIYINHDLNLGIPLLKNAIDCVAGIDIVEHFYKDKAIDLIQECERVAKEVVVFFIPVGNHPQTEDDRGLGNDYYQTHRSNWYPEDMINLGYQVNYIEKYHNQEGKDTGAMFCIKRIK